MKVYIVIKYNYIDGDLDSYVESDILDVCQSKELALQTQKKYILQFASQEEIENLKKEIEKINSNKFQTIDFNYNMTGVGVKEYDVKEK